MAEICAMLLQFSKWNAAHGTSSFLYKLSSPDCHAPSTYLLWSTNAVYLHIPGHTPVSRDQTFMVARQRHNFDKIANVALPSNREYLVTLHRCVPGIDSVCCIIHGLRQEARSRVARWPVSMATPVSQAQHKIWSFADYSVGLFEYELLLNALKPGQESGNSMSSLHHTNNDCTC